MVQCEKMIHVLCFWMLVGVWAWIVDVSAFYVNETSLYEVVNGDDVTLSWNYQLLHDEKMLRIDLLFTKNGVTTPLAAKTVNKTIERFPLGKDNALYKRYTEDAVINIDDYSVVELTLKEVHLQTDDNVLYQVFFHFSEDGSEDEKTLTSTVSVVDIPVINRRKYKRVVHVVEGEDVRLRCKTDKGKPTPNVTWYKEDLTKMLTTDLNSASLTLTSLMRGDDGNYTCVASNLNGKYSDRYTVSVVVQYPPSINLALSSKRVGTFIRNPHTVYLKCVADGNPKPTYKWNSPSGAEVSGASIHALMMPVYEQFGKYICEASNGIGDPVRHFVTVYEIKKPQRVSMNVTHWDKRSATISLNIPDNPGSGSLKEVILSYRGGGTAMESILSSGSTFVKLEGLTPFTKYEVNITVSNEYWTSDGQRTQFQTKSDVPGPPVDVTLQAVSSTVMKVAWKEPSEKNGEINNYKVEFYKFLNEFQNETILISENTETVQSIGTYNLTMSGLQQYSLYRVCVTASTFDFGKPSCVDNTTLAPMPGKPQNIVLINKNVEQNQVGVSWFAPVVPGNVPLLFYNIDVNCTSKENRKIVPIKYSGNIRDVTTVQSHSIVSSLPGYVLNISTTPSPPPQRETKVTSLPPYSVCSLRIREGAGRRPRWGLYESLGKEIVIEESIPDDVKNLVLKSLSHDQMVLSWQRPDRINGVLKKFLVRYSDSNGDERIQELTSDLANKTFFYTLLGLKQMTSYTVEVSVHTGKYESLNPVKITKTTTQQPTPIVQLAQGNEESTSGPIIGGIFTVIFILVLSVGGFLYFSRRKKRFTHSASTNSDTAFFEKQGNGHMADGRLSAPVLKSTFMMNDYEKNAQCTFSPLNPVPITCLKDLVLKYHENKEKGFSDEFRSVKCEKVCSLEISSRSENKCKNRYANILAYDHSRVVLNTVEDLDGSDYVNANYIDGYNKKAKFIATQGPVVAAFNDFWRMVWEQDTSKIIMVTNLVEKSRIKCQKYWPECEQGELYGDIKVEMIDEILLAEYVVRRFTITQMNGAVELSSRTVTQYQFLSWPDHGVPQYPTALLQFVKRVRALDDGDSGPIVCHCSAGVGRTGTYIALDAMLDQIEHEKTVDLLGYVTHIRSQRQLMVQTEAQYTFIYDTLLEAVLCGDTEVNTADLFAKIKHLNSINPGSTKTYMDEEFLRLSLNIGDMTQYDSALLPCNIPKNRYPDVLPFEETRVKLWPYANIEGSDYINASFIDGYQHRGAYILTQSPLENTVEEFWRMLWEYEVYTIVMISSEKERSKHHCWPYWPLSNDSTLFGILAVQLAAEEDKGGFIRREFRVINSKNGDTRTISHFMYFNWPIEGSPETAPAIEMIGQVQKTQQKTGNSAIVIHCSDGSSRSGALAALMYCLERLKLEGLVDIFQTVRAMRTQRIGLVRTQEQYQFIYMAVSNFLDCFSNYANFK